MNLNDHPVLVAPRPVRLTQSSHAAVARHNTPADRVRISESSMGDFKLSLFSDPPLPELDQLSPRSSPRPALPSEALEEFLSILRPSCFPPASPMRRNRRQGTSSLPVYAHDRSLSYHSRGLLDIIPAKDEPLDGQDMVNSRQPSRNATHSCTPEAVDIGTENPPFRWFKANVLSSPISRNHTRNPFSRQHANESPCPASPLSPAAIPLPLPSPEEIIDMS